MPRWNEKTVNEVANLIDPYAVARVLLDALETEDVEPTLENAKKAWDDVLTNAINYGVTSAIRYAPAFASERPGLEPQPVADPQPVEESNLNRRPSLRG